MDERGRKIGISHAKRIVEKAGLYLVPKERYGELAKLAADAYENYPLHEWLAGGEYDPVVTRLMIESSIKPMSEEAVIYADSEELNCFAVLLPGGFNGSKAIPFIKNGGFKLILHSGPGIVKRLLSYEDFAMKMKKKYTGNADWYLYNLSTIKKLQGKGIASKLMWPMLEFFDRENISVYLETNKESNVSIYEHFGFELVEEAVLPGSGVMHYAMKRYPKDEEKNNI